MYPKENSLKGCLNEKIWLLVPNEVNSLKRSAARMLLTLMSIEERLSSPKDLLSVKFKLLNGCVYTSGTSRIPTTSKV